MCFFFFKQKTAYEMLRSLVGSEMCIRDSDELLLLNGAIYTGRAELPRARALAARDGRILYVLSLIHI